MKNVLRLLVFVALVTVFALPSYAQAAAAAQTPAATGPCAEAEAKAALYNKFRENFNKSADLQKVAYESGKEYLGKYGACTDPADVTIINYIQNWVGKYEKATLEFNCSKAANENPAQAFDACAPWVAANPDNPKPQLALVGAGIKANQQNNKSLNPRAAAAARSALQLIESGKTSDTWAPFATQQDAAAGLRYYIAAWTFETNPDEAATQLLKVAQSNSAFSKEPATFQLLGASYYTGEFKKLADEYKQKYENQPETPESAALYGRINVVLDRIIDAYARAVALSAGKPQQAQLRTALTTFYKQRNEGKEDGLNELIAGVLNKPLPIPGREPVPAPATSTNGAGGAATPTTPAAGTTPPATPATPAATPTPKPAEQKPPRS